MTTGLWRTTVFSLLCAFAAGGAAAQGTDDGRRTIDVKRFGIVVRAPLAWNLVRWAEDDKAFMLRLPQEQRGVEGNVTCELSVAQETLEDYRRQQQEASDRQSPTAPLRRKLVLNQIEPHGKRGEGEVQLPAERLMTHWELRGEPGTPPRFELAARILSHDTLYTFTLLTDEAHFAAYRLDFQDLLDSAQFTPPETGVQRMPQGFWMQREYRFALRLPAGWKPAFGPNDKALLFATGTTHEGMTDQMVVQAAPKRPIDLNELRDNIPQIIAKAHPEARLVRSEIVPQGNGSALETVFEIRQGATAVTVLERRFHATRRNYELRAMCQRQEFERAEAELRKAFDSFREVAEQAPGEVF